MRINVPCKDCTRRYMGCHEACADYAEFKQAKTAQVQEINKDARVSSAVIGLTIHAAHTHIRKKGANRRGKLKSCK